MVVLKLFGGCVMANGISGVANRFAPEQDEISTRKRKTDAQKEIVPEARSGFLGLVAPSYLLCFALLAAMIAAAGLWEFLANTRILAALLDAGIVALGEDDPGLGTGVPGVHYFFQSQELITWTLLLLASSLFIAVTLLKGLQFHRIARFLGIKGSFSQHLRAFIYGHAIGRMTPYKMGEVAWASALESQGGGSLQQAARLVFIFKGFLLFEIATFAVIGFVMSGLLAWAMALIPPLVILYIAWLLTRPSKEERAANGTIWQRASEVISDLAQDRQLLIGLMLLSLISFSLVEFATYIIPQAFSTLYVPLVQDVLRYVVVTPAVVVMAVVAGYIARLISITPGGVGQFELAFALVLIANRLPVTEAITLAFLVSFVRYSTGLLVFGSTMLFYGIETNFNRVRALFERTDGATLKE